MTDDFTSAVRSVDWTALSGAYGRSDGSAKDGLGNVPAALVTLATNADLDSDAWQDAIDVLWSHVWHQGTIYAVTPHVVPFVVRLLAMPCVAGHRQLAGYLVHLAGSADRYERSKTPKKRDLGLAINSALEAHTRTLVGWVDGALVREALFLAIYSARFRDAVLVAVEQLAHLPFCAYVALGLLDDRPAWACERAAKAMDSDDPLERLAAAYLIGRCGKVPDALLAKLDEIVTPDASITLTKAMDVPFEFELRFPPRARMPFRGALVEASVIFRGPNLVVVRTNEGKNVTLPWRDAGVSRGGTVWVGVTAYGEARVVEWNAPGGGRSRIELAPPPADRAI